MNLTEYLMQRQGMAVGQLSVISAIKTPGKVQSVDWNVFRDGSIDIERSWVAITWDNGQRTFNSVDFMTEVQVA